MVVDHIHASTPPASRGRFSSAISSSVCVAVRSMSSPSQRRLDSGRPAQFRQLLPARAGQHRRPDREGGRGDQEVGRRRAHCCGEEETPGRGEAAPAEGQATGSSGESKEGRQGSRPAFAGGSKGAAESGRRSHPGGRSPGCFRGVPNPRQPVRQRQGDEPARHADLGCFRFLGDPKAVTVTEEQDPRELLVGWLRRPDNPFFARAIVNRTWAHYFGRGLVDPPDDLSPLNPPTHPELLQELCDGFIRTKYDLRWLHRTILTSRTYQQASTPSGSAQDTKNYARYYPKRLMAEIVVDALHQATGTTEKYSSRTMQPGSKALEIPVSVADRAIGSPFTEFAFVVLGRPLRRPSRCAIANARAARRWGRPSSSPTTPTSGRRSGPGMGEWPGFWLNTRTTAGGSRRSSSGRWAGCRPSASAISASST